jgi:hypothetical protein
MSTPRQARRAQENIARLFMWRCTCKLEEGARGIDLTTQCRTRMWCPPSEALCPARPRHGERCEQGPCHSQCTVVVVFGGGDGDGGVARQHAHPAYILANTAIRARLVIRARARTQRVHGWAQHNGGYVVASQRGHKRANDSCLRQQHNRTWSGGTLVSHTRNGGTLVFVQQPQMCKMASVRARSHLQVSKRGTVVSRTFERHSGPSTIRAPPPSRPATHLGKCQHNACSWDRNDDRDTEVAWTPWKRGRAALWVQVVGKDHRARRRCAHMCLR